MPLHNLANPDLPLPSQLVFDTSFLLALRPVDDNPHTTLVQAFARRLRPQIAAIKLAAWLVMPVLQECYHIILTSNLRRAWQELPVAARPTNWLALYKQNPKALGFGFADIEQFDALLAAYPITVAQPHDLVRGSENSSLDIRLRHFIQQYQLLPQDALILTEAERLGVMAVVTLDSDWRRVASEFDVYTIL
jgi:predicted nucleic acid-binding protein